MSHFTNRLALGVAAAALTLLPMTSTQAHGIAGNRFFPTTLTIDDPAVMDELTLPQINLFQENEDGKAAWVTEYEGEYSKRLTDRFGLSLAGTYIDQSQRAGGGSGFDNFGLGAKYNFYQDAASETLLTLGLDWDIGGTGSKQVDAAASSSLTPQFFFGKGFGDLSNDTRYLRPIAVTGAFGIDVPLDGHRKVEDATTPGLFERERNETALSYGFTLQYSLDYLQHHVKDVGLPAPFDHMTPLVEFAFNTPLNGAATTTTGTINPGVAWIGDYTQATLEAIMPINGETGRGVGVAAQLHFYLDNIFPETLGKPLF